MNRVLLVSIPLGLSLALAVAGCTVLDTQRRETLLNAVRDYGDGLRWARVDQSASHLPLGARPAFADKCAPLGDEVEVVDYEVQRIELHPDNKAADVQLDVTWSMKRRGLVERTVVKQHWDKAGGSWLLTKQERLKGSPLALLE